jgi:CRISPR/Cas system-associated protein Csx1
MRADNGDIPSGEQVFLLQELQNLLEKQIESANQGNIKDVESLSRQANSLVEKCLQSRILGQADLKNQREKLQKLYEQLSLALSAQRAETSEQLSRIRKGIKTLHVYRGGI